MYRAWVKRQLSLATTSESGVTAIEYGLIAALVAVAIVTALTLVGTNMTTMFDFVSARL